MSNNLHATASTQQQQQPASITLNAATTTTTSTSTSATPQQQALNALGGFSFTIFQSRNNIVLFHSNKLTPTSARKHYPIVEEVPQKRLEQLAFRSAQGGCVVDAAMHAHGAPWIVVVEPVYIGGNFSTTTTTTATCSTATPTKVVSTPSKNGGILSPSSPQPTNMNVGNANSTTTTTTSAGRQLKYFRVILVSSFAINVAERQDSMQVLYSAAAIVMTLKCGNTLRTLLTHPQVLRHMSNYVLEFGVKSTLDWREAIILGNTSRDTVTKIHADPRAAELFDKLQSTFYSLIALTAFIPAPPLRSTSSTTPPPSSKKQGGGGSSSQATNAAIAAAATTHSIGAARVPSLSSKNLTTIVDGDRSFPTLKLDALYADMQQFHAQGPSSPSSSAHRGGASQQPLPPPPPLSTGGATPLNGNKWFHRALLELQQYDAGFLSSVVSGVLSLSKRFSDVDGTSARSTLSAKAKAQGAGGAYHEFWVHEQRLHEKELRDRRKARRSGSRPSAAAAPAAAAVGNLGESQPPSMRDEDDDDGMALNNSSFGGTGTQPATRVTTPAATPTKSAPPSELNAAARGASTTAAQRSIYHHPPFPFSYQRTNTRLYGGGGAAREEEEALGPNACGSAAPGHGLRVSASHAGSIDHLDPFSQPVAAAEAHAQSLQPTSVLYGSPSAPAPQKHKLVASSLMANSEMYLDAMDPSSTSSPTTNKPRATSAFFGATTNHNDDSAAKAIFANNTPEARIFVFTRDVTMARNLLAICSFFYCHQHPYVDLDDALRSSAASLNRCPSGTESSQIGNLMGHAAFPGTFTDTLALTPTLPIVWVPEEWSQRFPMEQLTHRLSPDTHILVIVPRMQVVERLQFNKHFSTRDIALERRQNGTLVKQLPYGLSNGCFYAELVRQDAVVANKFVTSTIQRALRVESRSKGVLSASSYLEEWMGILLQQVVVFVTENATSGRCTAAVAEAVLQASTRGSPSHRAGSPAAAAALAPQHHLQAPKPRPSNMSASGGGGGSSGAGDTASKRNILTSTHSTTTSFSNGDNNPASHTMPAAAAADALSIFNRDLQGLLMCTEVDISHVQLLNFLAEL